MPNPMTAAQNELVFPGDVGPNDRGNAVKRVQEWLTFQGFDLTIDGSFKSATASQLNAFQRRASLPISDSLTQEVWDKLVEPLAQAIRPVNVSAADDVGSVTLKIAQQHYQQRPLEVGGENRGPWVRAYMDGNDGADYPWCAGFATFVVAAACEQLNIDMPVLRTYSCDALAVDARSKGRLLTPGAVEWATLGMACIFLVQRSSNDWVHTGIAFSGSGDLFSTIEGNTNENGSSEGYEVCQKQRSLPGKSIVRLI